MSRNLTPADWEEIFAFLEGGGSIEAAALRWNRTSGYIYLKYSSWKKSRETTEQPEPEPEPSAPSVAIDAAFAEKVDAALAEILNEIQALQSEIRHIQQMPHLGGKSMLGTSTALKTEIFVNLNVLPVAPDELLLRVPPFDERFCPEGWLPRFQSLYAYIHEALSPDWKRADTPKFFLFHADNDGHARIAFRAEWNDRKPLLLLSTDADADMETATDEEIYDALMMFCYNEETRESPLFASKGFSRLPVLDFEAFTTFTESFVGVVTHAMTSGEAVRAHGDKRWLK